MLAQIRSVLDILTGGFKGFRELRSKKDRDSSVIGLLRFSFLLKDCVDEAETLITEAGRDPVAKIKSLEKHEAQVTIHRWDLALRRQGVRLGALEALLFGETALAIVNPGLQVDLQKAIGYKMDRVVTLHGIGSALFLRCMLPMGESDVEKAELVVVMAGESGKTINTTRVQREAIALRQSLDKYRGQLQKLVSNEDIIRFSKKARRTTQFPHN